MVELLRGKAKGKKRVGLDDVPTLFNQGKREVLGGKSRVREVKQKGGWGGGVLS